MGERCEVHLEKYIYQPGEMIRGKVDCNFLEENNIRNIRIRFKGHTRVRWSQGKNSHRSADEDYFEMESNLLLSETTFSPGTYTYPFSFNLPVSIPSSLEEDSANIKYSVTAVVDRPWAIDYKSKKEFTIFSFINLNFVENLSVAKPFLFAEEHVPMALFSHSGPIKVTVRLPKTGYLVDEMVCFKANIDNRSSVAVEEVRFKLVQGFNLFASGSTKVVLRYDGQDYAIIGGDVPPGVEKSWDLELRIPSNIFVGNLTPCRIIQPFWELRGTVRLPLLHKNIKIQIPLVVGSVPIEQFN